MVDFKHAPHQEIQTDAVSFQMFFVVVYFSFYLGGGVDPVSIQMFLGV